MVVCLEPCAEERFRITVGSRDVQVADAGGVRGVEDLATPGLHRRAGAFVPQVAVSPDVDVRGTPQCGEAEPDPRGHEAGLTQTTDLHVRQLDPSGLSGQPRRSTRPMEAKPLYALSFA